MIKKIKILLIMIGTITLLVLAVSSLDNKKIKKESSSKITTQKNKKFKIGDNINLNKVTYTVNGTRESEGIEFQKPKEGNKYFLVDVTIENKSTETKTISSILMFKLLDSKAYNYGITFFTDQKGSLDGEISAGGKLRGEVTFEIPKIEVNLELDIDPSIFGTGKFTVDLVID
jgi:hypothetical protein